MIRNEMPDGGLARAHETDQGDVVDLPRNAHSRCRVSSFALRVSSAVF